MNLPALRIAQVAPLWAPIPPRNYGGIELVMKLLIDELVAKGHEVSLIASADCLSPARLVPVCPLNLTELMETGEAQCYEYYASRAVAASILKSSEYDILHYHLLPAWLPLAALSNTPSIFTLHHALQIDDVRIIQDFSAVAVTGVSHAQVNSIKADASREIPIVYNGVDFTSFTPRNSHKSYLAFLGRLSPSKNPLGAIRLAKKIGMPLVIAGEPLANENIYFHECIEPLLDGKDIRWIGSVNHRQKNELLANAAALLFPIAWDEPFGLVMIEAMACGTPVLALNRGSVPEVVDQGLTGFYADSLEELETRVHLALGLSREKVRSHAEARFSHKTMAQKYIDIYSDMIPN